MTAAVKEKGSQVQFRVVLLRLFIRFNRYLLVFVAIVTLGAGYAFVIRNKINHVRTVSIGNYRQKERELKNQEGYRDRLREMAQKFKQQVTAEDRALLGRALPEGPQIPNLMSLLDDIMQQNGYTVSSLAFSQEAASSPAAGGTGDAGIQGVLKAVRGETTTAETSKLQGKTLTATLIVKGPSDYASLKKLMAAIESSERLLDISSLSFTIGQAESAPGSSSAGGFTITISTLYLPESAPPTL